LLRNALVTTETTPPNEAASVAAGWYVAPKPPPPTGWLVFSEEYLLRALQGTFSTDKPIDRSTPAVFKLRLVQSVIGTIQAIVMLLAMIPILAQFVEGVIVNLPRGTLGFLARAAFWKTRLAALGQDTLIERGVTIWGAANITVGSRVHLDTDVRLAAGEGRHGQAGKIVIGDYTHLGPRVHVAGRGGVEIGDFVSLEAGVHIYSATNVMMKPDVLGQLISISHVAPLDRQHTQEGPIQIGDYVTIGFQTIVFPKVTLGQGAIVHPYSQVTRSFPAYANVAGPGRAKQNGWRRALRRDPRLDQADLADATGS
jgi:acetyltransferase-like isoleucine patch superfamily enzyme